MAASDLRLMRLIDCYLLPELRSLFFLCNQVLTQQQLDAQNSNNVKVKNYYEEVAKMFNDTDFIDKTICYDHFHEKLAVSYTIYAPTNEEDKLSTKDVKDKFTYFCGKLITMLENYQRSRNSKCNFSEESCDKYKKNYFSWCKADGGPRRKPR